MRRRAWEPVGLPQSLYGMEPQAVATLNGQPAWTVGLASAVAINRRPMLAKWAGDTWQRVPGPWKAYGILNAVDATSAEQRLDGRRDRLIHPLANQRPVERQHLERCPRFRDPMASWRRWSTWRSSRASSFGPWVRSCKAGRSRPLVMKHEAAGWTSHDPIVPAGAEAGLADVTRAPGGRIWAAGWKSDVNGTRTSMDHLQKERHMGDHAARCAAGRSRRNYRSDIPKPRSNGWAAGFVGDGRRLSADPAALERAPPGPISQYRGPAGRSIVLNAVEATVDWRLAVAGIEVQQLRTDILATRTGSTWQVTSLSPGTIEISSMADLARLSTGVVAAGAIDRQPVAMVPCLGRANRAAGRHRCVH